MAIEYRNGKAYYYRKKRIGDKIVSEYRGSGELALIVAKLESAEQEALRKERAFQKRQDEEIKNLEKMLYELFSRVAIANGYHKPKRQWKKKRTR